jgi:hypothetical protein
MEHNAQQAQKEEFMEHNVQQSKEFYQPPFLFAQGLVVEQESGAGSAAALAVANGLPAFAEEEVAVSHKETWPFSGSWLQSKSSKPICGNNTTNWEASRTAKSRGEWKCRLH